MSKEDYIFHSQDYSDEKVMLAMLLRHKLRYYISRNGSRYLFTGRRAVRVAHALVDAALDHALQLVGRGGRRKVEGAVQQVVRLALLQVSVDHHRLGRALLANQQHRLDHQRLVSISICSFFVYFSAKNTRFSICVS